LFEAEAGQLHTSLTGQTRELREASYERLLVQSLEHEAQVEAYRRELKSIEGSVDDRELSIRSLLKLLQEEKADREREAAELRLQIEDGLERVDVFRRGQETAMATASSLALEVERLHAAHALVVEAHEGAVARASKEHEEACCAYEGRLEERRKEIEVHKAEKRALEEAKAASRMQSRTQLHFVIKAKQREAAAAAAQHERMREDQEALAAARRRDSEDAQARMATLQQEKADEAATMRLKLERLKKLQELALCGVDARVERKADLEAARSSTEPRGRQRGGGADGVPARRAGGGVGRRAGGGGGGGGGGGTEHHNPMSASRTRGRQMLYWEVLKTKLAQAPSAAQGSALVAAAIDREKGHLEKYGAAIEREQEALAALAPAPSNA
jgi:hypothetical protein